MAELVIGGGELNITIRAGKTFDPPLTWKDADGNVVDMSSGYSALWVAKGGGAELFRLTESSGLTLSATSPNLRPLVTASDTANWGTGTYQHELEVVNPDGTTRGKLYGRLTVQPEIATSP